MANRIDIAVDWMSAGAREQVPEDLKKLHCDRCKGEGIIYVGERQGATVYVACPCLFGFWRVFGMI